LREELESVKEKRARDVLAIMQQRDEVAEEVDSLREINEALRRDLARLKKGTSPAADAQAACAFKTCNKIAFVTHVRGC
jgi:hypothetical protein